MSRHIARRSAASLAAPYRTPATCTVTAAATSTPAGALFATRALLGRTYRHFSADDPFGERASLDEANFFETQLKDIDPEAIRVKAESSAINEGIFGVNEDQMMLQRLRRSLAAHHEDNKNENKSANNSKVSEESATAASSSQSEEGLSAEEKEVLAAQRMTGDERRVASTLPGGFSQWLALSPREQSRLLADYAFTERQRAAKDHWSKRSYSSYEEYIRREVIGASAEDFGGGNEGGAPAKTAAAANDASASTSSTATSSASAAAASKANGGVDVEEDGDDEMGFEDDGDDGLTSLNPRGEVPLPNLGADGRISAATATGADRSIGDADAMRAELRAEAEAAVATEKENAEEQQQQQIYQQGPAAPPYRLPSTDPSKWGTEDVVAWLDTFAEEGVMDEEMIRTFRMARVDGDMLLNKVMPPNLFKVMRKWHLHRSNPRTLHLAEGLVVDTEMVQYTIYLCFPYCGQIGS